MKLRPLLLLAAAPLAPLVLFGLLALHSHDRALEEAEERSRRKSELMSEHVARVVDLHVQTMDVVDLRAERVDVFPDTLLDAFLAERVARSGTLASLNIFDRRGEMIASNVTPRPTVTIADRPYFATALNHRLVIGAAITGRASQQRLFPLARQRRTPEGGVIVAALKTSYFEGVFASAARRDEGDAIVSLVREDGTVLAHHPPIWHAMRLGRQTGLMQRMGREDFATYRAISQSKGTEHIYSYRKVDGYPLYLVYGIPVDAALRPWRQLMAAYGGVAAAFSATLVALALLGWRQARVDLRTEARLKTLVAERTAEAERRAAEAEMATRQREHALRLAERASAEKSHFFAAASHDLRQPAQALRLFLDVMKTEARTERQKAAVAHGSVALSGMEDLLQSLLDVSVLEAGTVAVQPTAVPLAPLFGRLADEFGAPAGAKGLRLVVVRSSLAVDSDAVLLHRLLRNLVSNAVKYTHSGRILIGARRRGEEARIEVWDSGIGIPADALDKVFDDFYQLDNQARDRRMGFGLGLGIVSRTAALLGHRVGVRSVPGKGSVFAVTAPIARCVPALAEEQPT